MKSGSKEKTAALTKISAVERNKNISFINHDWILHFSKNENRNEMEFKGNE